MRLLARLVPKRWQPLARLVLARARAILARLRGTALPAVGKVDFGDLRRTSPISRSYGYDRGGPVDRYYIESFLEQHAGDVRGRVLEVGDDTYTRRFGGAAVTQADVLHIRPGPGVAFAGDLADGSFLPSDTFDCIICTQTLHLIYDFPAALRTLARILAPGGVLLLTVPGLSNVGADEWGDNWHYAFTHHSIPRACAESFPGYGSTVRSYGNVLAVIAFLHGLGVTEITQRELDEHEPAYSLVIAARVVKPTS